MANFFEELSDSGLLENIALIVGQNRQRNLTNSLLESYQAQGRPQVTPGTLNGGHVNPANAPGGNPGNLVNPNQVMSNQDLQKITTLQRMNPEAANYISSLFQNRFDRRAKAAADKVQQITTRGARFATAALALPADQRQAYIGKEIVNNQDLGDPVDKLLNLYNADTPEQQEVDLRRMQMEAQLGADLSKSLMQPTAVEIAEMEDADLDRDIDKQNANSTSLNAQTTAARLEEDKRINTQVTIPKARRERAQGVRGKPIGTPRMVQLETGEHALQTQVQFADGSFGTTTTPINTPVDQLGQTAKQAMNNAVTETEKKEAAKLLAKTRSEIVTNIKKGAREAGRQIPRLKEIRGMVEKTGTGLSAELIARFGKFLPGVDPTDSEALLGALQAEVLPVLQNFPGALSDKELEFAASTQARLGNTTEANIKIIDHLIGTLESVQGEAVELKKFQSGGGKPEDFGVDQTLSNQVPFNADELTLDQLMEKY